MLQPYKTLPNPKRFLDIILGHLQIWKSPRTFFAGTCYSRDYDVMGQKIFPSKPIKFCVCVRGISCWSIFAVKPTAYY